MANKLTERREQLGRKIMAIFHAVQDMHETREKGIGKYSIKRTLKLNDETLRVSINTIKRIVDKMLDDGVIECVNPDAASGARFRLKEVDFYGYTPLRMTVTTF